MTDTFPDLDTLQTFSFGDSPALADDLLDLVLQGHKTGTCWPVRDGTQTTIGQYWVVLDGAGRRRAVIQTLDVKQSRFDEVSEPFAHSEGEGDRSLAYWREAHRACFERNGGYAPDMMLWCETFRLVRRLD